MRRELCIAQPELSNEVLPPDSDFPPPEPLDVRGAGADDVGAGAGCGLTGGRLTGGALTGAGVAGAETGTTGVATATVGVLGAADASAGAEAPCVVGAVFANCACAARAGAAVTIAATGGELARRTGIAGPAEAVEILGVSCSRGVLAGRSERPSAKKPANAATQRTTVSAIIRAYVATGPRSVSKEVGTRTVFMTDRRSAWFRPG
jgi:hypothetical protein